MDSAAVTPVTPARRAAASLAGSVRSSKRTRGLALSPLLPAAMSADSSASAVTLVSGRSNRLVVVILIVVV